MATSEHNVSAKPWLHWGISKGEFDLYMEKKMARDAQTPKVDDAAPDFEAERLSADGKRTGKMFQFSSTRGRPVALVMGSYT